MSEILAAPRPVAPATAPPAPAPLETVPENSKSPSRGHAKSASVSSTTTGPNSLAPNGGFTPKTDKPRPHICLTCNRSFARLEHLKRHERSHTKEKPFECPECARCFARRDLLLRHQQKLHSTTTPSSRPRAGRRESTSSILSASAKVRKTSIAQGSSSMRPRANTISHIGNPALEMFANGHIGLDGIHQPSMMVFGRHLPDGLNDMSNGPQIPGRHGLPAGLPKLDTSIANVDMSGSLRTAPVFDNFNMDAIFSPDTTVNPAALHLPEPPATAGLDSPSPFHDMNTLHGSQLSGFDMDPTMDWMGWGPDLQTFHTNDSNAIAGSSPSAMDSDSPDAASEYNHQDRRPSFAQHTTQWQSSPFVKTAHALPDYMMDMGLSEAYQQNPPSPSAMPDFANDEQYINSQFQFQNAFGLNGVQGFMGQQFPSLNAETPSTFASTTDSARNSTPGGARGIAIPEATRHAIMVTLAQPAATFGSRKTLTTPTVSSPLSLGFGAKATAAVTVPSTAELQKFIASYLRYFHPHIPIFHVPTLSFDAYGPSGFQQGGRSGSPVFSAANGGGCLILAMSAIGALYEGETEVSKALFGYSKKILSTYLDERRKADISSAMNAANATIAPSTPTWLVQAMLLNVIYGHMCGDKTSEISAQNHGAALVSLARAANLTVPSNKQNSTENRDDLWNPRGEDPAWYEWRVAEEKKRTLFAVFNVSSLLTSAYNHPPALKNTEIELDLPCDEDLWGADSAEAWYAMGGSMAAEQNNVPFGLALSNLLSVRDRQRLPAHQMSQAFCNPQIGDQLPPGWPRAEFHASTYGCLVLINALHNYIFETRQRHASRQWTAQETEDMHRCIEPALIAWQAVWSRISHHSVEHPNPHGMGPLAADSIPLLDLAYLSLYINLGRSKECFWQRDFEEMSREIASGFELPRHGVSKEQRNVANSASSNSEMTADKQQEIHPPSGDASRQASRCERHLREAASHAANILLLANRAGATFADFSSRELTIQHALCQFECGQVLAEWIATLQDRVGPYIGVLGLDQIGLDDVPAVILLEPEDIQLLKQLDEILHSAEIKMEQDPARFPPSQSDANDGPAGYSARILQVVGRMLDGSSVWPVMRLMCKVLNVQAQFMKARADKSRIQS